MFESGAIPQQLAQFGGGDIFSLAGAVALGFVHPIAVGLLLVFAIGFATTAVAGERQRGTLEVLLSRPLSRRDGLRSRWRWRARVRRRRGRRRSRWARFAGALLTGRTAELGVGNLPVLWLNGALLFWAFGAIGTAGVGLVRPPDARRSAITLAFVLVSYFLEILGSLWPDAKGLQPLLAVPLRRPADGAVGLRRPRRLRPARGRHRRRRSAPRWSSSRAAISPRPT